MRLVLLPLPVGTTLAQGAERAALLFSGKPALLRPGEPVRPGAALFELDLVNLADGEPEGRAVFPVPVREPGRYALFTQHLPEEFRLSLLREGRALGAGESRAFKPDHEHEEAVSSVGIDVPGDVDIGRLNHWLSGLLQEKGQDIYRLKGVLSVEGDGRRHVFQGVHMLLDARADRPWGRNEERRNRFVFIGRDLDRRAIREGFLACLA